MTEEITLASIEAFIAAHPEALETLILNFEDQPTQAISMIERKQRLLETKLADAESKITEFVDISRQNQRLFQLCHALIQTLLKPQPFADAALGIKKIFDDTLPTTPYHLFVFRSPQPSDTDAIETSFVSRKSLADQLGNLVNFEQPVLGAIRSEESAILFPNSDSVMASCAIVPLNTETPVGVLSLGSIDINGFARDQDTLFVAFIGDLLAGLLSYHYFEADISDGTTV